MSVDWSEAYRNALQEHQGRESLVEAIRTAETAIEARHRELNNLPTGHLAERFALKTASKDLEAIKAYARLLSRLNREGSST
jgi:hypothetical protein